MVVDVWGIDPETKETIEWFLYTHLDVLFGKCKIIVQYYACKILRLRANQRFQMAIKVLNL